MSQHVNTSPAALLLLAFGGESAGPCTAGFTILMACELCGSRLNDGLGELLHRFKTSLASTSVCLPACLLTWVRSIRGDWRALVC